AGRRGEAPGRRSRIGQLHALPRSRVTGPGPSGNDLVSAAALRRPGRRARPGHDLELVETDDRPVAGYEADLHRRPIGPAPRDARRLFREVAVAPLHQGEERNPQLATLRGQAVLEARRALAVLDALEDAFGDEPLQAIGEDVARDAEALEQLL